MYELKTRTKVTHLLDFFHGDSECWRERCGLPWCDRGYRTKGDIRDDAQAIQNVRKFWHYVKLGEEADWPDCMVHHTGTQIDAVLDWVYPATINFGEAMFTTELIEAYRDPEQCTIMAYNYINDPIGNVRLYHRFNQQNRYFVKIVINVNTVPAWLLEKAFLIHLSNIDLCHYVGEGIPDARRMITMYDKISEYFINTPLKLANGTKLSKHCGVPENSFFSELISSTVCAIIVQFLSLSIDSVYAEDIVVLGKTALARVQTKWNLSKCQHLLQTSFGMSLNLRDSKVKNNLKKSNSE